MKSSKAQSALILLQQSPPAIVKLLPASNTPPLDLYDVGQEILLPAAASLHHILSYQKVLTQSPATVLGRCTRFVAVTLRRNFRS